MRTFTADAVQSAHNKMVTLIDPDNLAQVLGPDRGDFNLNMGTAIEESLQTLNVLVGLDIPEEARVLEVGAGYGLASVCLALMGFSVTALEPGGTGFDENRQISSLIIARAGVTISHIDQSAETFDFSEIPQFDLIISNNVLEHIPDVDAALSNLYGAMNADGIMVHSCPNYTFPFEPHFGRPLVPFAPRLTQYLISKGIREDGVWRSLNFVTARQVKRNAKLHGLLCEFRRGTMATSIRRLTVDEEFAERHALLALMVRNRILRAVVTRCLSLPVTFATPMEFVVGREDRTNSKCVKAWAQNR